MRGRYKMPVSILPPPPPDNRMAELDALLRGKPQDAPKRQGVPRVPPAYLTSLAAELRARAVARAAHARECRARLRAERKETTRKNRKDSAEHAREVQSARRKEYEHAQVVEALARSRVSPATVAR